MSRRFDRSLRLALLLFAVLVASPQALAQRAASIAGVGLGFENTVPIGVWVPARVDLVGGDAPQTCVVELAASRNGREVYRVRLPLATTPNAPQRLELPLRAPHDLVGHTWRQDWTYRVTLRVPGVGLVDRWDSERDANTRLETMLFEDDGADVGAWILQVDDPRVAGTPLKSPDGAASPDYESRVRGSGPNVYAGNPDTDDETRASLRWEEAGDVRAIAPGEVPRDPHLLSVAHTVVLTTRCAELFDDAQVDALLDWCAGGGRLLFVGDRTPLDSRWGLVGAPTLVEEFEIPQHPAAPLVLESWPRGLGWVRHTRYGMGERGSVSWAVVDQWLDAIGVPEYAPDEDPRYFYAYAGHSNSGDVSALNAVVSRFGGVRPPSVWLLFFFVVVLALLVGPVDRFVMKRLGLLHRAWASGLVVVLICCGLGVLAPEVLRSGEPRAGVVDFIDVGIDGTVRTERTVGVLSGSRHTASFSGGADPRGRVWQHLLEGSDGGFLGARPIAMRDGAKAASVRMRPMTLVGLRESYQGESPFAFEQFVVNGVPEFRIVSSQGLRVDSVAIRYGDKRSIANVLDAPGGAAQTAAFAYRGLTVSDDDTGPRAQPNGWRADPMGMYLRDDSYAVVTIEASTNDAEPPPGVPAGVDRVHRAVTLRAVIELDPAFRDALAPPLPQEVDE